MGVCRPCDAFPFVPFEAADCRPIPNSVCEPIGRRLCVAVEAQGIRCHDDSCLETILSHQASMNFRLLSSIFSPCRLSNDGGFAFPLPWGAFLSKLVDARAAIFHDAAGAMPTDFAFDVAWVNEIDAVAMRRVMAIGLDAEAGTKKAIETDVVSSHWSLAWVPRRMVS